MKELKIVLDEKKKEIFIEQDCAVFKLLFDKKVKKVDVNNTVSMITQYDESDMVDAIIFNCFIYNVVVVKVQDGDMNDYVLILRRKRG